MKKVLLADDSSIVLDALSSVLLKIEDLDIVGTTTSVKETIESIKKFQPNILILDFRFEDGNCLEVLRFLKMEKLKPTVYIFTNYSHPAYKEVCLNLGATYFFKKLSEAKDLINQIKKIVNNKEEE